MIWSSQFNLSNQFWYITSVRRPEYKQNYSWHVCARPGRSLAQVWPKWVLKLTTAQTDPYLEVNVSLEVELTQWITFYSVYSLLFFVQFATFVSYWKPTKKEHFLISDATVCFKLLLLKFLWVIEFYLTFISNLHLPMFI